MAPNGSQRLPTAPYDYKYTLLLFSSSMTPTDSQRLPPRELTPQPHSQALVMPHTEAGIVSMVNGGVDTNGSQVCTKPRFSRFSVWHSVDLSAV